MLDGHLLKQLLPLLTWMNTSHSFQILDCNSWIQHLQPKLPSALARIAGLVLMTYIRSVAHCRCSFNSGCFHDYWISRVRHITGSFLFTAMLKPLTSHRVCWPPLRTAFNMHELFPFFQIDFYSWIQML